MAPASCVPRALLCVSPKVVVLRSDCVKACLTEEIATGDSMFGDHLPWIVWGRVRGKMRSRSNTHNKGFEGHPLRKDFPALKASTQINVLEHWRRVDNI